MAKRRTRGASVSKPTTAFVLTLIGGVFILIAGILTLIGSAAAAFLSGIVGGIIGVSGAFGTVAGLVVIFSAVGMHTTNRHRLRMWSVMALVFAIISIVNTGGFGIGFLLALVGSIIGLAHNG